MKGSVHLIYLLPLVFIPWVLSLISGVKVAQAELKPSQAAMELYKPQRSHNLLCHNVLKPSPIQPGSIHRTCDWAEGMDLFLINGTGELSLNHSDPQN